MCVLKSLMSQVRIDFVDTEMLTPSEGSCKDQYMSISGNVQNHSNLVLTKGFCKNVSEIRGCKIVS